MSPFRIAAAENIYIYNSIKKKKKRIDGVATVSSISHDAELYDQINVNLHFRIIYYLVILQAA